MSAPEKFSPEGFVDITANKDGGVLKHIIRQGEGDEFAFEGCKAYVHYVGRIEGGDVFDSSRERGEVFSFIVGRNAVIKGWDLCMPSMQKKELCEVKISPKYGYGKEGFPPKIPENSTLVFEIELLEWENENITKDNGVRKRLIKAGDSANRPNLDSLVKIHLRASYEGRLFDERDVEFIIGEGYKHKIVEGVEKAIVRMKRFEKSMIYVRNAYAYKDIGCEEFGIPANAKEIEYEVCLFRFERAKEIFEMDYDERIERSNRIKSTAAVCIKDGEYAKALGYYKRILQLVNMNEEDSDYARGLPLMISTNCNAALCHLKLDQFIEARKNCIATLKLDDKNVKAYFRLGEANMGLKEFKRAIASYENTLKIEPTNLAAQKGLVIAKHKLRQHNEKEKKFYGSIMSKYSEDK